MNENLYMEHKNFHTEIRVSTAAPGAHIACMHTPLSYTRKKERQTERQTETINKSGQKVQLSKRSPRVRLNPGGRNSSRCHPLYFLTVYESIIACKNVDKNARFNCCMLVTPRHSRRARRYRFQPRKGSRRDTCKICPLA